MAAADSQLFHIDVIVVDGKPVAFEDTTATITGAARYERTVVTAASGPDAVARKRVPTMLRTRILFTNAVSVDELAGWEGVQITARDTKSGRRALMNNCNTASVGDLGGGAVDITFNVLEPIQWL